MFTTTSKKKYNNKRITQCAPLYDWTQLSYPTRGSTQNNKNTIIMNKLDCLHVQVAVSYAQASPATCKSTDIIKQINRTVEFLSLYKISRSLEEIQQNPLFSVKVSEKWMKLH